MSHRLAAKIAEWRGNTVLAIQELFNTDPDDWQEDVANAFNTHQRIAMKACKGPGKSAIMAMLTWVFMLTRPHPKVVATSITGPNLRDGLWAEMAKWQKRSPILSDQFVWTAERIYNKQHPETWFASARNWPKDGDPTQQADTLAGIHADYVLIVIDEAGGIPEGVVSAADAALSTGIETKMLMAGNPTHRSGPLFNACVRDRRYWYVAEITGDPDDPKRAKRIDLGWAKKQIDIHGRDNPWVMVNVLGQFPPGSENTLLTEEEVRAAMRRTVPDDVYQAAPKILGIDVARFGSDRTAFTMRQGLVTYRPEVRRNWDTMRTTGFASHLIQKHKPAAVFVDQTGLGSGVVDRLMELGHSVIGIDNSMSSPDPRCYNMRSHQWIQMVEWVKRGGCLPNEPDLANELWKQEYAFHSDGRWKLPSKAEIKKKHGYSPDLADSLGLTFALPVVPHSLDNELTQGVETKYDPFRR